MVRIVKSNSSGRKEIVWKTEDGGYFGAYGLKDWFLSLSVKHQDLIFESQYASAMKSGGMNIALERDKLTNGPVEIHSSYDDKYQWSYSDVPSLIFLNLVDLTEKFDLELVTIILNEWISRAVSEESNGAKYLAFSKAVEIYWSKGYTGAKEIRANGLHNEALQECMKFCNLVVDLLKERTIPKDSKNCKPLDRLFLLLKLTDKYDEAKKIISEIERFGYKDFFEVSAYKIEFSKPKK